MSIVTVCPAVPWNWTRSTKLPSSNRQSSVVISPVAVDDGQARDPNSLQVDAARVRSDRRRERTRGLLERLPGGWLGPFEDSTNAAAIRTTADRSAARTLPGPRGRNVRERLPASRTRRERVGVLDRRERGVERVGVRPGHAVGRIG